MTNSIQLTKEVTYQYIDEVIRKQNMGVIDSFFLNNTSYTTEFGRVLGAEGISVSLRYWYHFFDLISFEITNQLIDGGQVFYDFEEKIKHKADFKSLSPHGKEITYTGSMTFFVIDKKILAYTIKRDITAITEQLTEGDQEKFNAAISQPLLTTPYEPLVTVIRNHLLLVNISLTPHQIELLAVGMHECSATQIAKLLHLSATEIQNEQAALKTAFHCDTEEMLYQHITEFNLIPMLSEVYYLLMITHLPFKPAKNHANVALAWPDHVL